MTNETPGKIFALLGVALTSMAFLFVVTATNASFSGTEPGSGSQLLSMFNPDKVMAVLDNVSASYSHFLAVNLFQPARQDALALRDTGRWIIDNTDTQILAAVGLSSLAKVDDQPQVAGAFTQVASAHEEPVSKISYQQIGLFQFLGIQ